MVWTGGIVHSAGFFWQGRRPIRCKQQAPTRQPAPRIANECKSARNYTTFSNIYVVTIHYLATCSQTRRQCDTAYTRACGGACLGRSEVRFGQSRLVQTASNRWLTRQSPPTNSKPEAINFPATHYEMSEDATPFVAPNRYPSPPKNMWYEVPTTRPGNTSTAPAAIFPWESKQPEPTRAFPEVEPAADPEPPLAVPEEDPPAAAAAQSPEPSALVEPVSPWASFRSVNAWDELPEINRYVQARNLGRSPRQKPTPQPPLAQPTPQKISALRLTDFPSENDRPSLPVTPAPVRRASFWDSGDGERSDKPAEALLPNEEATYDWVCMGEHHHIYPSANIGSTESKGTTARTCNSAF